MNVVDLLGLPALEDQLALLEPLLVESVVTGDAFLDEVTTHLLSAGGKRLRPVLALATATSGAAPATREDLLGAVSVELVHLASLYHDDVMDEATMRRNVESVNSRFGNLVAIVAGDFLAPSLLSSLDAGRAMIACLNEIGVTHVVMGNHEDDVPIAELRQRVGELDAVWLGTNVHGFEPELAASDVVTVTGGGGRSVRVGLVGVLMTDPAVYRLAPFGGARLEPANEAAVREARRLLSGARRGGRPTRADRLRCLRLGESRWRLRRR